MCIIRSNTANILHRTRVKWTASAGKSKFLPQFQKICRTLQRGSMGIITFAGSPKSFPIRKTVVCLCELRQFFETDNTTLELRQSDVRSLEVTMSCTTCNNVTAFPIFINANYSLVPALQAPTIVPAPRAPTRRKLWPLEDFGTTHANKAVNDSSFNSPQHSSIQSQLCGTPQSCASTKRFSSPYRTPERATSSADVGCRLQPMFNEANVWSNQSHNQTSQQSASQSAAYCSEEEEDFHDNCFENGQVSFFSKTAHRYSIW